MEVCLPVSPFEMISDEAVSLVEPKGGSDPGGTARIRVCRALQYETVVFLNIPHPSSPLMPSSLSFLSPALHFLLTKCELLFASLY